MHSQYAFGYTFTVGTFTGYAFGYAIAGYAFGYTFTVCHFKKLKSSAQHSL